MTINTNELLHGVHCELLEVTCTCEGIEDAPIENICSRCLVARLGQAVETLTRERDEARETLLNILPRLRDERRAFATWLLRWETFDHGEIRRDGIEETVANLGQAIDAIVAWHLEAAER